MVILSVWAVVLLGLPLWWKTTRVYRAELPYDSIEQWNQWKTCRPRFPIRVNLHLPETEQQQSGETPTLKDITQGVTSRVQEMRAAQGIKGPLLAVEFIAGNPWKGPTNHIIDAIVQTSDAVFESEEKILWQLLDTNEDTQGIHKVQDQLKTVKYAPGYQLTFSLFSGDASNGVREWKMQEAINAYLAPFINTMSMVSKFTIESQIQHYASLTFTPQLENGSQEHFLTPDSLPNFINAAEWSLASTVSSLPSLNFLTYVPKPSESPLVIKTTQSAPKSSTNSFLIPRWGGVAILNREAERTKGTQEHPELITIQELEPVMRVFLAQLRDLLGVTDLSTSSSPSFPIVFHKSLSEAPTTWELDSLLRRRSAENLVDSLATISSLARLVRNTPNMVVLDHIQKDVTEALRDIARSCEHLSRQEYVEALAASRDGLVKSETAFFDPTMVSMLYFPDEHKYAIYMPLFVPISVPLLMSLLRELKRLKEKKKQAKQNKDSETSESTHDKQE
ncbi:GPI transamidase component [Linnemannia exigua]|uniref:GPI transamidase component n=1 Tax=Linnemannia exigua TaxID=604196 RepID=A0AAD4H9V8_9FUNG|nr:GPI transamidase component [Linnemannia exigua]